MDYDEFLSYAFPAFGILAAMALGLFLLIRFSKWEAPAWVGGMIIYLFLGVSAVLLLLGWFLPWGSPF